MENDNEILDIETFLSDYRERDWIKQAACRGMDPNIFFPERGDHSAINLAKKTCERCPVSDKCRDYGEMERFGFWGGVSVRDRQRERTGRTSH